MRPQSYRRDRRAPSPLAVPSRADAAALSGGRTMALRRVLVDRIVRSCAARAFASTSASYASARDALKEERPPTADELAAIPRERTRNFSIIAHVDHGKSTLADRLLELTGAIKRDGSNKQVLDTLPVERRRGITVKAQAVSILHREPSDGQAYLLNLIDTPGHADFSFEVSRSLSACDGAVMLVDATQGVEAQTIATFYLALDRNLAIVPAANKVDMTSADVERVAKQMERAFGVEREDVLEVSGKTGHNAEKVLSAVVKHVPHPSGDPNGPLRVLLLDCHYDDYRGAVNIVQVADGVIRKGDKVTSCASGQHFEVLELGMMTPERLTTYAMYAGQVGYMITNVRDVRSSKVGDTLHMKNEPVEPLAGIRPAKPMVFQGLYPVNSDDFEKLKAAVSKLTLNDASVTAQTENSTALGAGFRCGFLGLLHADVFHQRLQEEFGAEIIATAPTVPYRIKHANDEAYIDCTSPLAIPSGGFPSKGTEIEEPLVEATIICQPHVVGKVVELCMDRRGEQLEQNFLDDSRVILRYRLPLGEVAADFADELKSRSSGYATFDYDDAGMAKSDIVRMDVLVNGSVVDALATLVHRSKAQRHGRDLVARLKEALPRQLYEVALQAALGSKVIARETISAMRKNVTAKCYGGDISRKKKLLEKQKEGKRRMRRIGNVDIPNETFAGILSNKRN
jgi:GTP-binding protein LepA